MKKTSFLLVTGFLFSYSAFAAPNINDPLYYTIKKATLTEIDEAVDPALLPEEATDLDACSIESGGGDVDLDKIINYGKMLWKFIQDNKPVVNVKRNSANALPKGIQSAYDLDGWSRPIVRSFRMTFENGFGMDVVDFTFRVAYTAGGTYQGKGKYLSNVTMIPARISVAWGYTFNANVVIANVVNVGKRGAPIAGIDLQMQYSVDTVLKHFEETYAFFVQGDGQFFDQNH